MARIITVAGFTDLTKAETLLIAACKDGRPCKLEDGIRPTGESDARTIRADLLALLITGGSADCGPSPSRVQLTGAYITGTLRLSHCKARGNTWMDACHFAKEPFFDLARFQLLSLEGSHLPGLYAPGIQVKGDVFLRTLTATGTVDLNGAKIGGQLACVGATLNGAGGMALNAQGVEVGASLILYTLTATGTVAVNGAKIGGQLSCTGATLNGAGGEALNAQGVEVGASLILYTLTATGTVAVNGAKIGGQLSCTGATLNGAGGEALNAQGAEVGADVFLRSFTSTGTVDLGGAKIAGQLDCERATLDGAGGDALNAQRMVVTQGFYWRKVTVTQGQVYLASAHVGDLVDDRASWPTGADQLILDGFAYDRISGAAATDAKSRLDWLENGAVFGGTFYPQPYTQLARVLSEMGHDRDARDVRIAAKKRAACHARGLDRTMRNLARAVRRFSSKQNEGAFNNIKQQHAETPASLGEKAKAISDRFGLFHTPLPTPTGAPEPVSNITRAFAQKDFRNQMWAMATKARLRIGWSWIENMFLNSVVGYGYAPMRSLAWLFGLFLIATALASAAWNEGSFAPNSDVIITSTNWTNLMSVDCIGDLPEDYGEPCIKNPADYWSSKDAPGMDWDTFNPIGYGLDLVVPILTLGQTDAWAPSKDRGPMGKLLWWGRWVLISFGWIVSALGAAAITGIIQRK